MAKKKSLAQLPIGSKEWDEEKLRQDPSWGLRHVEASVMDGRFGMSKKRITRLTGQKGYDDGVDRPEPPDEF